MALEFNPIEFWLQFCTEIHHTPNLTVSERGWNFWLKFCTEVPQHQILKWQSFSGIPSHPICHTACVTKLLEIFPGQTDALSPSELTFSEQTQWIWNNCPYFRAHGAHPGFGPPPSSLSPSQPFQAPYTLTCLPRCVLWNMLYPVSQTLIADVSLGKIRLPDDPLVGAGILTLACQSPRRFDRPLNSHFPFHHTPLKASSSPRLLWPRLPWGFRLKLDRSLWPRPHRLGARLPWASLPAASRGETSWDAWIKTSWGFQVFQISLARLPAPSNLTCFRLPQSLTSLIFLGMGEDFSQVWGRRGNKGEQHLQAAVWIPHCKTESSGYSSILDFHHAPNFRVAVMYEFPVQLKWNSQVYSPK